MSDQPDKLFLRLHSCGLLKPVIRYSRRLRKEILQGAHYNTDMVTNQLTYIDLVTDSLKEQVLIQKDFLPKGAFESGFLTLNETFQKYFGFKHVLPVAQGRTAELILAKALVKEDTVIPNNLLFITTRSHQELAGARLMEITVPQAYDVHNDYPFKGNVDVEQLEKIMKDYGHAGIPYIFVETSVNASGGHPVSMANMKAIHDLAKKYEIPVMIDACRILENAWLIKERESGYADTPVQDIVREFCSYTDGCTMSATKDFYVDTGGFIATNSEELYYRFLDAVMVVGDGLSVRSKGRLQAALLKPFTNESMIRKRMQKSRYLWDKLKAAGIPVVEPACGYAVFIDARPLHEHVPEDQYPERAFLVRLYLESGILGSENMITDGQKSRGIRMIRLALPLQSYRLSHMDYVAHHVIRIWNKPENIRGLRKIYSPPSRAGQFLSHFEPVEASRG